MVCDYLHHLDDPKACDYLHHLRRCHSGVVVPLPPREPLRVQPLLSVSRSVERHVSERPFCVALLHQFRAVMAQPVAQFEVTVALSSVHHPSDSYSQAQVRSEVQ